MTDSQTGKSDPTVTELIRGAVERTMEANPFPVHLPGESRPEFSGVELTEAGTSACDYVGMAFSECLTRVEAVLPAGRERSIVVIKLQEACSWAKRGVAHAPGNGR